MKFPEGASVRLMGDPLTTKNALATKFIAYELPADFVQDFAGDRAAVTAVIGRLIRAGVKEVNIVDVTHATSPTPLAAALAFSHSRGVKRDLAAVFQEADTFTREQSGR